MRGGLDTPHDSQSLIVGVDAPHDSLEDSPIVGVGRLAQNRVLEGRR